MRKWMAVSVMLWIVSLWTVTGQTTGERKQVTLDTSEGKIVLELYDETPLHRDQFLNHVRKGVYDGRTFNRVIRDFVVQCGEEEEADVIPAEIQYPQIFHRRGVLAMGRCTADPTHELKSANEQFYIVWGCLHDAQRLQQADSLMQVRSYGRHRMDPEVRQYYQEHPGLPALDGSYTIFGEVVEGLEIVERIQATQTNTEDRPIQPITIHKAFVNF